MHPDRVVHVHLPRWDGAWHALRTPMQDAMILTRSRTGYDGNASAGAGLELDRHADQRGIELQSEDHGAQADDHAALIFHGAGVSLAGQLKRPPLPRDRRIGVPGARLGGLRRAEMSERIGRLNGATAAPNLGESRTISPAGRERASSYRWAFCVRRGPQHPLPVAARVLRIRTSTAYCSAWTTARRRRWM